jgi:transketolase
VDLLVALYFQVLRIDPARPAAQERDRFILSKAHAGIALYATLARRGFFSEGFLADYYVDGGHLAGHADAHGVPGVEVSAGSLGHGLALATGMALYAKRRRRSWRVYVMLSDGECDEGSTWEAALLAAHLRLDNLTAIVDYNGLQGLGRTADILDLEPFEAKWRAFNWDCSSIDGHDFASIAKALTSTPSATGRPTVVIAKTTKGKGITFMEHNNLWHYRTPAGDELQRALEELDR